MAKRERAVHWWHRQIVATSAALAVALVVLAGCASFSATVTAAPKDWKVIFPFEMK